jgi:hypothetical protein
MRHGAKDVERLPTPILDATGEDFGKFWRTGREGL